MCECVCERSLQRTRERKLVHWTRLEEKKKKKKEEEEGEGEEEEEEKEKEKKKMMMMVVIKTERLTLSWCLLFEGEQLMSCLTSCSVLLSDHTTNNNNNINTHVPKGTINRRKIQTSAKAFLRRSCVWKGGHTNVDITSKMYIFTAKVSGYTVK